jgi:hypothetical protein
MAATSSFISPLRPPESDVLPEGASAKFTGITALSQLLRQVPGDILYVKGKQLPIEIRINILDVIIIIDMGLT